MQRWLREPGVIERLAATKNHHGGWRFPPDAPLRARLRPTRWRARARTPVSDLAAEIAHLSDVVARMLIKDFQRRQQKDAEATKKTRTSPPRVKSRHKGGDAG
jgi:hypothetical protein